MDRVRLELKKHGDVRYVMREFASSDRRPELVDQSGGAYITLRGSNAIRNTVKNSSAAWRDSKTIYHLFAKFVDNSGGMASDHGSRAHSSDRESRRKRDRFIGWFKSTKSTGTTSTEPQIPKSEQSSKKDSKPPPKSETPIPVSVNSQVDGDGSQSQDLWMRAYNALERRDPELLAAYASHLTPTYSSTAPTRRALSPELIEAVIETQMHDDEAKKLVFHLGTHSIKVREQGEKVIKFILWSNDFISAAVTAQPYAALAWSGVSVLLPLLLNSSKQKEAMLTGLKFITDLLRLYKIREELYLQAANEPAHPDFVKATVELYTDILEYQVRLILYFSRSSVKRGIQGTFEWDDWSGMLKRVQNSDAKCIEYAALFDKDKEHRFYTEQSSQIEQSIEVQRRILEMFEAFQDARQQDRRDDREAGLLRTLASDYKSDKDAISTRVPGTCEWVFEDEKFLEWRDTKKSSLLWIFAGPGCGKSVLSRCLVDERRLCTNVMTSNVCYFFFKDGQEKRSKGSNAISAILHQLFEKRSGSSLLTHGLSSYKSYGEKLQDAFSELWDILIKSAKDPEAGEIICVLDALDECEENARKQLMEKLVGFFAKTDYLGNSSFTLKFVITSRPYEDLRLGFQPISSVGAFIRFDGDQKSERIGQDIRLVIDAKVPHIAGDFSYEDRERISDRLKSLDNRTYLWLFLTINIIEKSRSKYGKMSSIHKLLSSLPSSVSDAYEKILSRSSDKETAKILLQIVVAARRPLSLDEANIALSIATQKESCKSHRTLELWPSPSFKSTIQDMCGLFISVYDSKVFLIHQTAREFLISSPDSKATSPREWEGTLTMATAHGTMSQICLHYLNLQDFASIPQVQLDQDSDVQSTRKDYLFLHYAAQEWPVHYTSQDGELAQSSRKAAGMLCKKSLAQLSYWFPIWHGFGDLENLRNWTELRIASHLGLSYVVEDFLNTGADVNAKSKKYGTALISAAAKGHERIVEMLLNHNADVNAESRNSGTALIAAATEGHERIVEMLLDHNADVNAKSGYYGTALIAAATEGHEKIVEMLLNKNADFNVKDNEYGTALMAAALRGHEKLVETLLDHNADVNAKNERHGTALIAAALGGHEKMVEMLLNQNADVNAESGGFGTALIAAALRGHEKLVEMLLSKNADVNAKSRRYGTALIAAAFKGHEKMVEMLLNKNADVNAKGGRYGTALIAAAFKGHEKVVEMLLNRHADVNAEGGYYGTALIEATRRGHQKLVEMLLNYNADVNAESRFFGTALVAASTYGYDKVVELLLDRNAITGKDVALEDASAMGYKRVIELLLKKNPDNDFGGKIYRNALKKASEKLHVESVEMLLNRMIEGNVEVETYSDALEVALNAAGNEEDSGDEKDEVDYEYESDYEEDEDEDEDEEDEVDYEYDSDYEEDEDEDDKRKTPARVRGSTQDVKTKLELDFELKTHASIGDLCIAQSPQSRQHSGAESVRSSRVCANPKVTMLSMLTTMLRMFHLERKSVRQIKNHFGFRGIFPPSLFIGIVVGATTSVANLPELTGSEAQVKKNVAERMQMLEFILRLVRNGRSDEEIEGLGTHNWYSPDNTLVKELSKLRSTYSGVYSV
ncbi:hypothetical protein MMC22_004747 [Lobaria immixta]|nr:hypothetical protein [Lobaria immixta]